MQTIDALATLRSVASSPVARIAFMCAGPQAARIEDHRIGCMTSSAAGYESENSCGNRDRSFRRRSGLTSTVTGNVPLSFRS